MHNSSSLRTTLLAIEAEPCTANTEIEAALKQNLSHCKEIIAIQDVACSCGKAFSDSGTSESLLGGEDHSSSKVKNEKQQNNTRFLKTKFLPYA